MNTQLYLLLFSIVVAVVLLLVYVPKGRKIEAHISFLFMQAQSWLLGMLVRQYQLIIYPIRIMDKGPDASFVFEYVVFPTAAVLYNLYFPKEKRLIVKFIYSTSFPTIMTMIEVILEKETDLIKYINWNWYWSWLSMLITLNLSFFYYKWFMKRFRKE